MTPTHATPGSVLINLDQAEWASAAISIATGIAARFDIAVRSLHLAHDGGSHNAVDGTARFQTKPR